MRFAKLAPVADATKFFNSNRWIAGLFSKINNASAHEMIFVSHKALLSARQPFQGAPRGAATRLCLFPLERGASFGVAAADMSGVSATEEKLALAVGDGCQYVDAAIDAYHGIVGFIERFNFSLEGDRQKHLALASKQTAITYFPFAKVFRELWGTVKANTFHTPVEGPNTHTIGLKTKVAAPLAALQSDGTLAKRRVFLAVRTAAYLLATCRIAFCVT